MVEEKEAQRDKKLTLLQTAVTGVQNNIKTKTHPKQTNKQIYHPPTHPNTVSNQKSPVPAVPICFPKSVAILSTWSVSLVQAGQKWTGQ